MILKRLKIKNIRSYGEEEILFPTGSVLLLGEIGAGKSTLLLAIEFALFGLRKTKLSGRALLRHGTMEGFVELECILGGKKVVIHRCLRAQQDDVKQDAGFLLLDGMRTDLTALELKSKMLELLGYPQSLLTKTKNLIFTYTVYTPQETMKHILSDDPDNRVDILRKVFGMDKYKQVRENGLIIARALREQITHSEFFLSHLQEKKELLDKKRNILGGLSDQVARIQSHYETVVIKENDASSLVVQLEKKMVHVQEIAMKHVAVKERAHALRASCSLLDKEQQALHEQLTSIKTALQKQPLLDIVESRDELNRRINTKQLFVHQLVTKKNILLERKEHLSRKDEELLHLSSQYTAFTDQLTVKQREYDTLLLFLHEHENNKQTMQGVEQDVITINTKMKEIDVHLQHVRSSMLQVSSLSMCPTCLQEVGHDHKKDILNKQQAAENEFVQKYTQLLDKKGVFERSLVVYQNKEELFLKKERLSALCKLELVHLEQNLKQLEQLPTQRETLCRDLTHTEEELALVEKQNISELYFLIEEDKKKLETLDLYQTQLRQYEQQKQLLEEKERQLLEREKQKQDHLIVLHTLEKEEAALHQELASYSSLQNEYLTAKKENEACHATTRAAEVLWKTSLKEYETISTLCWEMEAEVNELTRRAEKTGKLKELHFWLTESFTNLMFTLEKHLFVAIHHRFSNLFAHWFSVIMDDDELAVQLDDVFTPVVLQNGYEVPFDHLSGGERTSCALAYRLALNKVINDVQSIIQTRDILILDEPTEGFSSDQLDRVRLVLDELHLSQLIIVSHESKVEGFVEHVLRAVKGEQGSKVVGG